MPDIVRRNELALLDIHDPARAPGRDQQIGLAAKKRRDLQNVGGLGGGFRLRWLVNVGQHRDNPRALIPARIRRPSFEPRSAIRRQAGAIGLVERRFEDEWPGDLADRARQKVHVLLALDHARSGNQRQRPAASEAERSRRTQSPTW